MGVGVSGDLGYSHLSHSAFERTRYRAGGPPLGMEMLADAQVVDLGGTLRAAGILIEKE